ncbi:pyridoxamine 5'-phosphate oxidase family protein [Phycicoccus endophyticus]|uniref:Pyridoxamine 5'-phosphate oxidase family protein n=1 Tax=Phycicoccus endophyticus TaxID=1690220 RepID=A0A7G9R0I9_9MICO|nr:pyridoxamine 5'-phosphate oxidase family protein [Phycicoccus endophyticus]NHI19391.1 pyridoxamine 5'-phosphate oxidase family protein [Phycicoccus endophyticus]QNN49114.1 pyridoxamine 5'-phosphate oxidase family protein [Phycicoccus endophyticus]GGL38717.1 general stress protein [Phycicoccus endophyticus]
MTDPEGAAHVKELIEGQRTAMLTSVEESGSLVSRPMTLQEVDEGGTLWFLALADSSPTQEVQAHPAVNVAFTEQGSWVSVSGRAEVRHDPQRARELWSEFAATWFQKEPEDPQVVVIRVDGESAQYWDSPGRAATLVQMVTARLSGERPEPGGSDTVQL